MCYIDDMEKIVLPIKNFELLEKYREILGEEKLNRFLEGGNIEDLLKEDGNSSR